MTFKLYPIRHAITLGLIVLVALLVNQFYSLSHEGWVILSAFLVSQTTRGTSFRQGIIFFLWMCFAILLAFLLKDNIKSSLIVNMILGILFVISGFSIFVKRVENNHQLFSIVLFTITLFIATYIPETKLLHDRIFDVFIGSFLGIVCNYFILPVKFYTELRQGLVPLLQALSIYSQNMTSYFSEKKYFTDYQYSELNRIHIEEALQQQYGMYPEWVYELGFNPGLRSGFRFFLTNIEKVVEIYFSLSNFFNYPIDTNLLDKLQKTIIISLEKNNELLQILTLFLQKNVLQDSQTDFVSDIAELEYTLRELVPPNLELLDISSDYVMLTALVRNIKDLRKLLLDLVAALPDEAK